MKKSLPLFLSLLVLVLAPSAHSQDTADAPAVDPAKAEEIQKLMEVSGASKMMSMVTNQILDQSRATNSTVPTEFWDTLRTKLDSTDLMNQTMALYAKYYSLDDLKALNAFYQSPAGQHMIAVQPKLMQESMQLGMKWGQTVMKQVTEELAQEKHSQTP